MVGQIFVFFKPTTHPQLNPHVLANYLQQEGIFRLPSQSVQDDSFEPFMAASLNCTAENRYGWVQGVAHQWKQVALNHLFRLDFCIMNSKPGQGRMKEADPIKWGIVDNDTTVRRNTFFVRERETYRTYIILRAT